jgi:glycerol-3-phosphate cytidylyltransferase-like family protein
LGEKIIVALAPDNAVKSLKGHYPVNSFSERLKNLERESIADEIVSGDEISGNWTAIFKYNPDIIALGYDQTKLQKSLEKFISKNRLSIKLIKISPYTDKSLHSSAFPQRKLRKGVEYS